MARMCRVHLDKVCWNCRGAYREMIQRAATGATIHELNNALSVIVGACELCDVEAYAAAVKRFFRAMRRTM